MPEVRSEGNKHTHVQAHTRIMDGFLPDVSALSKNMNNC